MFDVWTRAGVCLALMLSCAAAPAKTVTIEFLQGPITPKNIGALAGLACRNYDHIVHLDISVNWPAKSSDVEQTDDQRLIFWDSRAEYLFPKAERHLRLLSRRLRDQGLLHRAERGFPPGHHVPRLRESG
jgi:hypothetical protein